MADSLDIDNLISIFSYLHGGMILRCAAVCKKWKKAVESNRLWVIIMGRELEDLPHYSKIKNIKINKEIAKKWLSDFHQPLKQIYLEKRRKEKIPNKMKVFTSRKNK